MADDPYLTNDPTLVTDGNYAGWHTWGDDLDPFEALTGPYYMKPDGKGGFLCGWTPEPKNLNGNGAVHGGAFMTFADFALFAHAKPLLDGSFVTVQFESQFIGAGQAGAPVVATGEVVRATRTMIFVRGLMEQNGAPVFAYSGILKRVGKPPTRS